MGYPIESGNTTRPLLFLIVQSSDHITGLTGATPTVTISKNGAAFAAPSGAVTEVGNGWYKVAANATDANTNGPLLLHATATSGDPTDDRFDVVSFNPDDAVRLGLTALPNAAASAAGGLPTFGTGTGQINLDGSGNASANVTKWNAHAVPAENVNGVPLVDAKYLLGTIFTTPATAGVMDVNVKNINNTAAATPGAAGGLFIAGSNAATTITGTAASGSTPATAALTLVGGAASTTGGGVSAPAMSLTGGAGAATTNGAAAGLAVTAGGTTAVSGNDGATFTGTGNGNGVTYAHAGSGLDVNAQTTNSLQVDLRKILGTASAGAAGYVGIDWGHINAPTTTNDLSGTTIKNLDNNPPGTLTAAGIAMAVWQDTTAGDFAVAGSIGKSLYTSGNAPGAASGLAIVGSNMGTVTSVSGAVGSVTAAVTLPTIPTNWITATGIAASALNGKGDWALAGSSPSWYTTPPTAASIATTLWTDLTAGSDFATAGSIGKLLATFTFTGSNVNAQSSGNVTVGGYAAGQDPATLVLGATATTWDTAGTIGAKINSAASAGDPWSTSEPGSYPNGTFGYLVAHFMPLLDVAVSTRLAASSYQASPVSSSFVNSSLPGNTPYTKTFTQGDLRTNIADVLVDATGTPINLTGSTVAFRMISQSDKSVKVNNAAANLDDAPNGKVSYTWQATDLNTPGLYFGWWIVTTGGKTEHFPGDGEKMTVKVVVSE